MTVRIRSHSVSEGESTTKSLYYYSFVSAKGNQQWVSLAIDVDTREVVGVYSSDSLKATLRESSVTSPQAL